MAIKAPAIPPATFTRAIRNSQNQSVPQCIAHRGYNAICPENTLVAFRAAIAAGAQALETDIHLTKDHVVVLSHDATVKRCFGKQGKIIDMEWDCIKDLKTLKEPKDTMPRLLDLLDLLSEPGHEDIWCLLDIKMDNNADDVMRLIGKTIDSHQSSARGQTRPWNERLVLGIWTSKFLPLCPKYLPGFPVVNIGFSLSFSRHFLGIENVGFNMLFPQLVVPPGSAFIKQAQQQHSRQVVAWTVNKKDVMEWCVRSGLDGVITDDPKLFLQVRDAAASKQKPLLPLTLLGMFHTLRVYIWITVIAWLYGKRIGPVATKVMLDQPAP